MSAIQVTDPCWVPSWPGDTRTDAKASTGPHYSGRDQVLALTPRGAFHEDCGGLVVFGLGEFCTACEDENPQWEEHPLTPRALPACWTVRCDGDCEGELENDEGGFVHFPSQSAAEHGASNWYDWRFLADSRAYCPDDAPAGAYLVGEQVGEQLTFPEVAAP